MLDSLNRTVGLCGFKGSGKDTAADYLVSKYGYQKISLADPLKKACQQIFAFPKEHLWGPSELRERPDERYPFSGLDPVDGTPLHRVALDPLRYWQRESDGEFFPQFVTPRLALQTMGTEWGRRIYTNIWVAACLNQIRQTGNDRHAIADVRFVNELTSVQAAGGVVIRLMRGERTSSHPSELELEGIPLGSFDFVINNNSTKEHLFASLDAIMIQILAR
jgi:hypothetical protein